ncbi:hypothetical protein RF11_13641 [Thelohanellus kitauei]|uniref:Uncharacterized protein n=1 Tax=Thelohanellus kitauei TaxID=669202 RepID=A0A0C2JCM6_THEKT|nr:hypothetical protein RF11_13641 [Thelohanellus kitauei]
MSTARADEAEFKEWCDERTEKSELAESEAKLNLLREKAGLNEIGESAHPLRNKGVANPEYEKEKRKKQEDYEKRIGALTGLGQSVSESNNLVMTVKNELLNNAKIRCMSINRKSRKNLHLPRYITFDKKRTSKKATSVEELRKQRLLREAKERKRQDELLSRSKK